MKITEDNILKVTPIVMDVLESWKLSNDQIFHILRLEGIAPKRDLRKYKQDLKALPLANNMAERLDHIFGIYDALRTSYPFNSEIGATWLRQPHRRFGKMTPLHLIKTEDIDGLLRVRIELDCAYGWSLFEAEHKKNSKT